MNTNSSSNFLLLWLPEYSSAGLPGPGRTVIIIALWVEEALFGGSWKEADQVTVAKQCME